MSKADTVSDPLQVFLSRILPCPHKHTRRIRHKASRFPQRTLTILFSNKQKVEVGTSA